MSGARPVIDRRCAAIVLAGGRGRRLGGSELGDKARVPVAGLPLLDRVLEGISAATGFDEGGAVETIVIVGPPMELAESVDLAAVSWAMEEPPGAGPCAAIVAGVRQLDLVDPTRSIDRVAVLAGDAPNVGLGLAALDAALDTAVDGTSERPAQVGAAVFQLEGRLNYLASLWRRDALLCAIERLPEGAAHQPVAVLYANADLAVVDDHQGWSHDIDTPDDLDDSMSD